MATDPALADSTEAASKLGILERMTDQLIGERDQALEMADRLAYAIAPIEVIGEHSSENCPWENALDHATSYEQVGALRDKVANLEATLERYVGSEPTVAEEMAYLNRCLNAVEAVCREAERNATRWEQPLPVPGWVEVVRAALQGVTSADFDDVPGVPA